jgi:perosamine synthetase
MTRMGKITPIMCNTLQEDDVRIAKNLLENNNRWLDPNPVSEVEKWLAQWLGVKKAFGFMGGRAALYNIVKALGLSRGDEVILPGLTCQVVVNAFEYNHVKCVHADIERETFNMDVKKFSQKVTSKTKAVLLQHTFGIPARDTLAIVSLAKKLGLIVIEDVAHGLGGKLNQKKLGTFGDVAFFSSERTKIINTIHGGFAACSDEAISTRLEEISRKAQVPDMNRIENLLNTLLHCYYTKVHEDRMNLTNMAQRKYGQSLIPQMTDAEFNGQFEQMYTLKMPGAVGELALNQLKKFESFIPLRQQAALKWHKWALNNGYGVANPGKDSDCTWLRYPVIVPEHKKKDTSWIEKELGMEPGVWFQTPCHPQIRKINDIPVGWDVANTIINLPTGLWVK